MKRFYTILIVIILITAGAEAAENTGFSFLKFVPSARYSAMGEAGSADLKTDNYSFINPGAGVYNPVSWRFNVTYYSWIQDINYMDVSVSKNFGDFYLGFSAGKLTVSDMERREEPTLEPIGMFSAYDFGALFSAGYKISDRMSAGANIKYVYEKIDVHDASTYLFDFYGFYQELVKGLNVSLSLKNIGSSDAMIEEDIELPTGFGAGFSYRLDNLVKEYGLLMNLDVESYSKEDVHIKLGLETEISDFRIRGGYKTGFDSQGISAGIGYRFMENYGFDYSYVPFSNDLGGTHRISISAVIR